MKLSHSIAGLVLIIFLGSLSAGTQPAPNAKVLNVLSDWKARNERYKCVRYTLSGTKEEVNELTISPEDQARVIRPPGPKSYPIKAVILVDLVNDRFRLEQTSRMISRDRSKWVPEYRVSAYNGKALQTSHPRERNDLAPTDADIAIIKGNLGYHHIETYLWPVFMAHGIIPTPTAPIWVDRFPKNHEPEEFPRSGPITHEGRSCLMLKTEPSPLAYEAWAETAKASAISRFIGWDVTGRNAFVRLDIRHRELDGHSLPESWTQTSSLGGKVMVLSKLKVDAVEVEVALNDGDYTLPVRSGMLVKEYEYPPRGSGLNTARPSERTYRAGEDGDQTLEGAQRGFTTLEGIELPPESNRRWFWWVAGLMALLLVAGAWMWRRSRRAAAVGYPESMPPLQNRTGS